MNNISSISFEILKYDTVFVKYCETLKNSKNRIMIRRYLLEQCNIIQILTGIESYVDGSLL